MKNFDEEMRQVVNDYAAEYEVEGVLEELFGSGYDIGEIIVDMFNSGLIPNDKMEEFVNG